MQYAFRRKHISFNPRFLPDEVDPHTCYIWGPILSDAQPGPSAEIARARSAARLGKFVARYRGYFVLGATEEEVVDAAWDYALALKPRIKAA